MEERRKKIGDRESRGAQDEGRRHEGRGTISAQMVIMWCMNTACTNNPSHYRRT